VVALTKPGRPPCPWPLNGFPQFCAILRTTPTHHPLSVNRPGGDAHHPSAFALPGYGLFAFQKPINPRIVHALSTRPGPARNCRRRLPASSVGSSRRPVSSGRHQAQPQGLGQCQDPCPFLPEQRAKLHRSAQHRGHLEKPSADACSVLPHPASGHRHLKPGPNNCLHAAVETGVGRTNDLTLVCFASILA
jgi:hypothetical protein